MARNVSLIQVVIYLAIVCVKFPSIRAQSFLQIADSIREGRPPVVQNGNVPIYLQMAQNFMKPAVMPSTPQGLPEFVKIAESLSHGVKKPTYNPPDMESSRPIRPSTTSYPVPTSPRTTTSRPDINVPFTNGPTSTTESQYLPMKEEPDDDDDKIFFEDWDSEAQAEEENVDYEPLTIAEGRPKVVIKRDHRGRIRPTNSH